MRHIQKVKKNLLKLLRFSRKKDGWWENMEFYHDRFGYVQPYQKNAGKKESKTAIWFMSLSEKVKLAWNNVISEVMVFLGFQKEYDPFGYQKEIKIHTEYFLSEKSHFSLFCLWQYLPVHSLFISHLQ